MKKLIVIALVTLGLTSAAFAEQSRTNYPPISFVVPGANKTVSVSKDQFVVLVIEAAYISHQGAPISDAGLAEYLDTTMSDSNAPYLAVHIREGITFGDVVHALDALRKTNAKSIAVSLKELPLGREV